MSAPTDRLHYTRTLGRLRGWSEPFDLTPVERYRGIWYKRDDLFQWAGCRGGKVRTCLLLIATDPRSATYGVVTAGSRHSPQVAMVARICAELGYRCTVHVPAGDSTPQVEAAADAGATVVRHRPGYNSVIDGRARADAEQRLAVLVPFGMRSSAAVDLTAGQCENVPDLADGGRIVLAVGSGMSLAGILHGTDPAVPVLGIVVGADPSKNLDQWAPAGWRDRVTLEPAGHAYGAHVVVDSPMALDGVYEAKAWPHARTNDLFWIIGHRDIVAP